EIRFHGRGGQGAVIASKILAQAILNENEEAVVQGFPEFGGERRGAPVAAYLRVDDRRKCKIYNPDYVIVLDDSLTDLAIVGLKENGWVILNTARPEKFIAELGKKFNLAFFDANELARSKQLGSKNQPIINTIILGIFVKASGLCAIESLIKAIQDSEDIPKDHEKNAEAAKEAFENTRIVRTEKHVPACQRLSKKLPIDERHKINEKVLIPIFRRRLMAGRYQTENRGRNFKNPRDSVSLPRSYAEGIYYRGYPRNSVPLKLLVPITKKLIDVFKRGDWRMGLRPSYQTKTAPCQQSCPAGNDIRGWLALIRKGNYRTALELLLKTNPLPMVCGTICHHPCEANCNRKDFDEAIAIKESELMFGWLRMTFLLLTDGATITITSPPKQKEKIAVVGSGPAGLSCAWQLLNRGYKVTIFEKSEKLGGMLTQAIPEFRLPPEDVKLEIEKIVNLGAEIKTNAYVGVKPTIDELQAEFDAVLIAAGAHKNRKLNITGESEKTAIAGMDLEFPNVVPGLEFLKDIKIWKKLLGKKFWRVVVIGGGNTAIDAARSAKKYGSEIVIVVYRRSEEEMPAQKSEIKEAKKEGINFIFLAAPELIRNNQIVKEITFRKMTLGEPDQSGRKKPVKTNETILVGATLIISAIGEEPDLDPIIGPFNGKTAEEKKEALEIMESQGIFIGGDALTGPSYVAQAIGQGRETAEKIICYLRGQPYQRPEISMPVSAKDLN
ncbi:MAG: FAD-dependent oxidoreductase, partial [bacterium]|nr:FAD-dependent oxidoreductase [bacterium]